MDSLTSDATLLNTYDMLILACAGKELQQAQTSQENVVNYANAGGRVFATHYSYVWFDGQMWPANPWAATAAWAPATRGGNMNNAVAASVDQSFDRGVAFAEWLHTVGASGTPGQISISQVRNDFTAVNAPAQRWLYDSTQPLHYTFNTPLDPNSLACGRALFSDFHVNASSNGGGGGTTCMSDSDCGAGQTCTILLPGLPGLCAGRGGNGNTFPTECDGNPMTPQEKALEFMMFDLASCVSDHHSMLP
jgi:hypothetical protein